MTADPMQPTVLVLAGPDEVAQAVADLLVDALGRALVERGQAVLALSGGSTPVPMYRRLAVADLEWRHVHVVQVDERVAADADPERNWRAVQADLVVPTGAIGHPMPVEGGHLEALAADYERELRALCDGAVDALHLGLGADGHTASLVPGDAAVQRDNVDVAVTGIYQGRRRMTMTRPLINRARRVVWQVVGGDKRKAFDRLRAGGGDDPSAGVRRGPDVWLVADEAAGGAP